MRTYYGILISEDTNTAYINEYTDCQLLNAMDTCLCVGTDLDTVTDIADKLNTDMSGNKTYVVKLQKEG